MTRSVPCKQNAALFAAHRWWGWVLLAVTFLVALLPLPCASAAPTAILVVPCGSKTTFVSENIEPGAQLVLRNCDSLQGTSFTVDCGAATNTNFSIVVENSRRVGISLQQRTGAIAADLSDVVIVLRNITNDAGERNAPSSNVCGQTFCLNLLRVVDFRNVRHVTVHLEDVLHQRSRSLLSLFGFQTSHDLHVSMRNITVDASATMSC
jgi:hypothetical protein